MADSNLLHTNRCSAIAAAALIVGVAGLMVGFEAKSPIGGMDTKSTLVSKSLETASSLSYVYPGSRPVVTEDSKPMLLVPVASERELLDLKEKSSQGGVDLMPYLSDVSALRREYQAHVEALQALPAITFEVRSDKLDPQGARSAERLASLIKSYPYITEIVSVSDGAVSPDLAKRRLDSLLSTLAALGVEKSKAKGAVVESSTVVEQRIITKATLQWQTS